MGRGSWGVGAGIGETLYIRQNGGRDDASQDGGRDVNANNGSRKVFGQESGRTSDICRDLGGNYILLFLSPRFSNLPGLPPFFLFPLQPRSEQFAKFLVAS